ncbi:hypothetical protein GP486_002712 [Trichoglossum hirsutum]|uniref:Zn(2)-C6 fungal-type domain-containing protein n=1 Tax=Trichoglossum hirsutum TaxID=265104 RepID=A0A9P8LE86_9PEZI|nr:hypothetical protein GP486_002712 [Trichoglossum hirsutum]
MQTPPLMNPPPQIFGGYNSDGSPIPATLPGPIFSHGHISMGSDDGHNDPKRRRIARACDMCRKKKIKCDGKMPACTHCLNYKTECVFTQVEKKRNPPKGAKYIEGLENRLGRMESLLRLSGLLSEEDGDLGTLEKRLADKQQKTGNTPSRRSTTSGANRSSSESVHNSPPQDRATTPPGSTVTSPGSREDPEEEVEALSDMMCSLVTNNCGESRFIGSSSGFSIFSPKGIQWVNEKTGDSSFQEMISSTSSLDDSKWAHWKPEIFGDLFQRRVFRPLPPKEEAFSLLKDFFDNFNCIFPLFHQPTFMHLVEKHYSNDPFDGSGWWASLNIALAIAHRLRVMSNLVPQEEDQKAWGYLKNALGVMTELTMRNTDLLSVQALLGMVCVPSFMIICLRSGRPPAQDDDDMNVELPSEDPEDNIGNIPLADGKGKVNIFRLMARFAIIESRVYKLLYSAKAAKQSDGELLNTIGELDHELEDWKDSIPIDFRPEHEIKASHTPLILHIVVLHFAYYNCLTTIHRMSIHHGYWTSRLSNYAIQGLNARPLNPRVFSSAALCVSAARASIHLIRYIPQGDYACVWLIVYYPVSALVTLFANILQNPNDVRARSDIKLMNLVVNFLSMLTSDEENGSVRRMLGICAEFERIAKVVLDRADRESSSRRKRKTHDDEAKAYQTLTPDTNRSTPHPADPTNVFPTPGVNAQLNMQNFDPSFTAFSPSGDIPWMPEYASGDPKSNVAGLDPYVDAQTTYPEINSPINFASFQQPFVPQDLWQMPMTLEWDWAEMSAGLPAFDGQYGQQAGGP